MLHLLFSTAQQEAVAAADERETSESTGGQLPGAEQPLAGEDNAQPPVVESPVVERSLWRDVKGVVSSRLLQ